MTDLMGMGERMGFDLSVGAGSTRIGRYRILCVRTVGALPRLPREPSSTERTLTGLWLLAGQLALVPPAAPGWMRWRSPVLRNQMYGN